MLDFSKYVNELERVFYEDHKKLVCFVFKDETRFALVFKNKQNYNQIKKDLIEKLGDKK